MKRRRRSSPARAKPPEISTLLIRRGGAPARPGKAALEKLFQRVWAHVPASRRPDLLEQPRITVDVLLVPDAEIADLNVAHLKVSGPTDVLSFPMGEVDPERRAYSLGEIVVSFETARREALARKIPVEEELSRYCAHGFLHLLGYEDATAMQRGELFAIQEKAL